MNDKGKYQHIYKNKSKNININRKYSRPVLIVFTKAPMPGKVKSRLMPHLTPRQCAALQEAFIQDIMAKFLLTGFSDRQNVDVVICHSPDEASSYFTHFGVDLFPQGSGDIGERMYRCLNRAVSMGAPKVFLIGSDTPHLDPVELNHALIALDSVEQPADMVFGPAEDGGYYLVGIKGKANLAVFTDIPWSSSTTLEVTEKRASAMGLKTVRLKSYFDIDTFGDLKRLPVGSSMKHTTRILQRLGIHSGSV